MRSFSLEQAVETVADQRSKRGLPMQPGLAEDGIIDLMGRARRQFGILLPERYLDILRITDGIEENGLQVFASSESRNLVSDLNGGEFWMKGILEQNEMLRGDRDGYNRLIVFACESLYVHALDLDSGKYIELPHEDDWPSRQFDTFEEMIISAIKRILRP